MFYLLRPHRIGLDDAVPPFTSAFFPAKCSSAISLDDAAMSITGPPPFLKLARFSCEEPGME